MLWDVWSRVRVAVFCCLEGGGFMSLSWAFENVGLCVRSLRCDVWGVEKEEKLTSSFPSGSSEPVSSLVRFILSEKTICSDWRNRKSVESVADLSVHWVHLFATFLLWQRAVYVPFLCSLTSHPSQLQFISCRKLVREYNETNPKNVQRRTRQNDLPNQIAT